MALYWTLIYTTIFTIIQTSIQAQSTCTIGITPQGNDDQSCGNNTSPCRTIKYAIGKITLSCGTTTVHIAEGTYSGDGNKGINISLEGNQTLVLQGEGVVTFDAEYSSFIFGITWANNGSIIFRNIRFMNGNASISGGCINIHSVLGKYQFFDCKFHGCRSGHSGGGIFSEALAAETELSNIDFSDCFASEMGGAVYVKNAVKIVNSTFFNNSAAIGGAIWGNSILVINSDFTSNWADLDGGAIFINFGEIILKNNIFIQNSAQFRGGALTCYINNNFELSDSLFSNNTANDGGALWLLSLISNYNLNFTDLNFVLNYASANGGGIFYDVSGTGNQNLPILRNITFSDNKADSNGGGIYISDNSENGDAAVSMMDVTLQNNKAQLGGGIGCMTKTKGGKNFKILNIQFSGNSANDCHQSDISGNCAGFFSKCVVQQTVVDCFNCQDHSCWVDPQGNSHCFNGTKNSDSCYCIPPTKIPAAPITTQLLIVTGVLVAVLLSSLAIAIPCRSQHVQLA